LNELYVSLAAVGGLLLVLGMLGGLLKERTFVSEPLIALLAGVLLGPAVFGLLDLADLGNQTVILEEAALVTLGVALVGVALRLPVGYTSSNWRLLVVLLGIVMPLMWLASGLLVYLILGLPFWVSVLIGAIVTPTDPVVASSIVAGGVAERNLPASLRHAISAESGFNDGLALPFVVLPVLVLTEPPGEALSHWLTHTVLLEIAAGAALAALMGYLAGRTLRWAERKETMERTSLLTISLALSLTVLGVTELLTSMAFWRRSSRGSSSTSPAAATPRRARRRSRKRYRASSTCRSSCCSGWRYRGRHGSGWDGAVCWLWRLFSCCDGCLRC